jgi:hypothetical protein
MPLTAKGSEILAKMKSEYGDERGERVFYASKNAGKITGVDSESIRGDALDYEVEFVENDRHRSIWFSDRAEAERFRDKCKKDPEKEDVRLNAPRVRKDSLLSEMDAITARLDAATDEGVRRALLVRMDSMLDAMDARAKFVVKEQTGPDGETRWIVVNDKHNSIVGHYDAKEKAEADAERLNTRNDASSNEDHFRELGEDMARRGGTRSERRSALESKLRGASKHDQDVAWAAFEDKSPRGDSARADSLTDDLRELKTRLAAANAENQTAVARALRVRIEALEERIKGASPEERGDASDTPNDYEVSFTEDGKHRSRWFGSKGNAMAFFEECRGKADCEDAELIAFYSDGRHKKLDSWKNPKRSDASTSPEYSAALEKSRAAERSYQKVLERFRAKDANATMLATAQKARDEARKEFDRAHAKEQARGDADEVIVVRRNNQTGDAYWTGSGWSTVKQNAMPIPLENAKRLVQDGHGREILRSDTARSDAVPSKLDVALARAAKLMGRHFMRGRSDSIEVEIDKIGAYQITEEKNGREGSTFRVRLNGKEIAHFDSYMKAVASIKSERKS